MCASTYCTFSLVLHNTYVRSSKVDFLQNYLIICIHIVHFTQTSNRYFISIKKYRSTMYTGNELFAIRNKMRLNSNIPKLSILRIVS